MNNIYSELHNWQNQNDTIKNQIYGTYGVRKSVTIERMRSSNNKFWLKKI